MCMLPVYYKLAHMVHTAELINIIPPEKSSNPSYIVGDYIFKGTYIT